MVNKVIAMDLSRNNQNIAGALTFPTTHRNEQPVLSQPRQPRTLQGLLKFAMEATRAEDAPGESQFQPLDDDRRKFLEEALKSLTVNVVEVLQKAIGVLKDQDRIHGIQFGEPLPQEVDASFDNILEYVDQMDIANDFYKLGGFAIFPVCYGSESDLVRSRASCVLAELCQNNPYCQARVLECGLLNVLINLMQTERGEALVKCLYAISCACREYEPACDELAAQGGCATLATLLAAPELGARTKAAFLTTHLCAHHAPSKRLFLQENIVGRIAEQIKKGHDSSTERLLRLLVTLLKNSDSIIIQQCRAPPLGLKNILEDHLKLPQLQEDSFSEEKEYCQFLLDKLFVDNNMIDDKLIDR